MSTGSSKSIRSRRTRTAKGRTGHRGRPKVPSPPLPAKPEPLDRWWKFVSIGVILVAAWLRLYNLDLVPLHHDEGVNGNFLAQLVRQGFYKYDPENYHGPTLYYFSAIFPWIIKFLFGAEAANHFGLTTVTIRVVTALFGLATVALILTLRRQLGTFGTLAGAALLALSPGAVYLSRYFIHETLFVFFALGIVIACLRFYEEAHPIYLVVAAASQALLFATKETVIINVPVLLIALFVTRAYFRLTSKKARSIWTSLKQRLGNNSRLVAWGGLALTVFIVVSVLFYSSFLTNFPKGVYDSLKTFQVWAKTGQTAHVHPWWKYLEWLMLQESQLLLLGVLGAVLAVLTRRSTFALFSALWAFGTVAAYSLIPYKTPWLTLNFIVPLALISGYSLQAIFEYLGRELRVVLGILLVLLALGLYQSIDLNFFNYDNDQKTIDLKLEKEPLRFQYYLYVYAHTRRETLKLVDEIERIASSSGEGKDIGVTIVSPDYWPLPWYLRNFKRVGYFGRMTTSNEPLVVASEAQRAETRAQFGDRYRQLESGLNPAGSFALRPGVELLLFVRSDVQLR